MKRLAEKERGNQSENIDQIPMYSDETLQAMLERIKAASFLNVPESVEKNAKIISRIIGIKKVFK